MTDYLQESRMTEGGKVVYSQTSYASATTTPGNRRTQDSIEYKKDAAQTNIVKMAIVGSRVSLPDPKSVSPNDLDMMTAAFIKAYSQMQSGLSTEIDDYTAMQSLDLTQSQCVLASTTNALKQQQAAAELSAQIADYQKTMAASENTLNWVMTGIGIGLMVITVVSGFLDFGASDAALPAEASLLTEADATGDVALDTLSTGEDGVGADTAESTESTTEEEVSSEASTQESSSSTQANAAEQNTQKTVTRDLAESSKEVSKSAKEVTKITLWNGKTIELPIGRVPVGFGKVLLKVTVSAGFGSPMLMKGIVNYHVADQLHSLSVSQSQVGQAMGVMQQNNMFFHFVQQLLQREGGILQEEASDASEVVDTEAGIVSSYRDISYGLANAV